MDIDSLKSQAERLFEAKDYAKAKELYLQITDREKTVLPHYRLATCHYKLKDHHSTIQTTLKAFELLECIEDFVSTYVGFMKMLGKSYTKVGEYSLARKAFQQVIEKAQDPQTIRKMEEKIEALKGSTDEFQDIQNMCEVCGKVEASLWHLVSKEWYDKWESHCKTEGQPVPGPINNEQLVEKLAPNFLVDSLEAKSYTNLVLKSNLIENKDFVLMPKQPYHTLETKYGADENAIKRWCVALDDLGTQTAIEVYLKPIKFTVIPTNPSVFISQISRKETVSSLEEKILRVLPQDVSIEQTRLWKAPPECDPGMSYEQISGMNLTLLELKKQEIEEAEIADEDLIILEIKVTGQAYGLTPPASELCFHCQTPRKLLTCTGCRQAKYCSTKCQKEHFPIHKSLCQKMQISKNLSSQISNGLQNLGFTCYMNAAIQCLAHTYELSQHFLSELYVKDINTKNPLGTGGALAKAYFDLLMSLFAEKKKVAPWAFKKVLNKVTNQFSGYQQHDSHELLVYVLSGLHEDTNRILNKPYVDQPDSDGKTDEVAASDVWNWFLLRNSSKIVDMLYGQCKSQLLCPLCNKQSVTFDPFLTLSVPIPIYERVEMNVYVVGDSVLSYTVAMNSTAKISDLKRIVEEKCNFNTVPTLYHNHMLKGILPEDREVGDFKSKLIIFYRSPADTTDYEYIPVLISSVQKNLLEPSKKKMSFIRLLIVPKTMTTQELYMKLLNMVQFKNTELTPENAEEFVETKLINSSKSTNSIIFSSKLPCDFCGRKNCENCNLEVSEDLKVQDLLDRMKNSEDPLTIDIVVKKPKAFLDPFENARDIKIEDPDLVEKNSANLYDCIRNLSTPEKLSKNNEWYCKTCKDHVQAYKTYEIYWAPNTLIVHLLRFKHRFIWIDKISSFVEFPFDLDLTSYVIKEDSNTRYELYAVINHYGVMGGGHYTAYVKVNDEWFEYDDSHVSPVSPCKVVSKAAYLLFYRKVNN